MGYGVAIKSWFNFKSLIHLLYLLIFLFFSSFLFAATPGTNTEDTANSPPQIGNFALPTSQQPGPLISFGQNIIEKGQTQVSLFGDAYRGYNNRYIDLYPSILYAFTDNFSAFLSLPVSARYQYNQNKSSGLEDATLQLEFTVLSKENKRFTEQATFVAGAGFPSGSIRKNPSTGVGALSSFLGMTYNRMYVDWFAFTSHGINLNASHHNTRFGEEVLYQFGLGRNLFTIDSKILVAFTVEINGGYFDKDKIAGVKNPNSGGNTIYVLPSVWISTQKLIIQFGAGGVVYQHLFGNQNKNKYLLAGNLGWTL